MTVSPTLQPPKKGTSAEQAFSKQISGAVKSVTEIAGGEAFSMETRQQRFERLRYKSKPISVALPVPSEAQNSRRLSKSLSEENVYAEIKPKPAFRSTLDLAPRSTLAPRKG